MPDVVCLLQKRWEDKDGKLLKKLPLRNYGETFINPLYEAT